MLFVLAYGALYDIARVPGGPPCPEAPDLCANAGTLEIALTDDTITCVRWAYVYASQAGTNQPTLVCLRLVVCYRYEPLLVWETAWTTTPPGRPAHLYPPVQADAITVFHGEGIMPAPLE